MQQKTKFGQHYFTYHLSVSCSIRDMFITTEGHLPIYKILQTFHVMNIYGICLTDFHLRLFCMWRLTRWKNV